ncbi:hypothetical protein TVAG_354600 [Trichomonas vaginalis G3]|uniref:Uncharacterized protein n=1 Tax=Trichomonas vaginalis (strain ATCC PRA-98 / G3) TaxID=412133 RepID=A2FMZ2_TRIV3|nr:hypothetical protein TVAGG3_0833220 [Trichomonas vaginalis G3]EAX93721.1 hypothetical protein TVAG_354600 [Trichomonas vaginalis G3]KAI5498728.1 hypothetical protein TVAGG3_0833220 [Trichomonas vaginalis G3]|eukprot:XP_001306651.1 hypothetical protein [Trichomonas vaginalis G3]
MSVASSVANDKLTDLRMKKKQAIQSLNFDAAEEYDRQIEETNQFILTDRVEKIHQEILNDIKKNYINYCQAKDEIDNFQKKQEYLIRTKYGQDCDVSQKQFENESKSIDKAHDTALLREAEAEVPEQIEKLEEAKNMASQGKYAEAKQLMAEARLIGESILAARKERVDNEFEQSRSIHATKQQEEMERIEAKFEEQMEILNNEIAARQQEAEQRYQSGLELIRERAKIKCMTLLTDDKTKEDLVYQLNLKINDTVMALESGAVTPSYPTSSTRYSGKSTTSTRSKRNTPGSKSRSRTSSSKNSVPSTNGNITPSGTLSPK